MQKTIEIIVNNSELGAGTRGASLGPAAVITAARKLQSDFFSSTHTHFLPDFNHFLDRPTDTPFAKRIDGFTLVFDVVAAKTKELLIAGKFPIVLAGDHGSAAGTIAGVRMAQPDKRLGVIWIDAHADIHSPVTTPSGNIHGMPLAMCLNEDYVGPERNILDAATSHAWEHLKNAGGISPKIWAKDLIFVGVRDTEEEENALIEQGQIVNHTVEAIRKNGVKTIISRIEKQLAECDSIYVSFDVDSMDPELTSRGTGTPVPNGITPEEAKELLVLLVRNPKTVCIEIVEVNPCLDNKGNVMAETAFNLLQAMTEALNS